MIVTWTPTYDDGYLDGACGDEAAVLSSPYIDGYNAGKRLRVQKQSLEDKNAGTYPAEQAG